MEGCSQYYVLMLVVLSLPERVYVLIRTHSALGLNLSSVVIQGLHVVHLSNQVLTVLPGLYTRTEVLIYPCSVNQSVALPPIIGGTRLCLYFLLEVNSFTIV